VLAPSPSGLVCVLPPFSPVVPMTLPDCAVSEDCEKTGELTSAATAAAATMMVIRVMIDLMGWNVMRKIRDRKKGSAPTHACRGKIGQKSVKRTPPLSL
jgi:hypothetical protein